MTREPGKLTPPPQGRPAEAGRLVERTWRRAIAPPVRLSTLEWAEKNLRLSRRESDHHPGPYRSDRTPYVRGVLDAWDDPDIRTMYLCFGAQTGKTLTMLVCLMSTIAQDPAPSLWVMPSETLARSISELRLQPLIDETPALTALKPADSDDYKKLSMRLDTMNLALVGANSPANLSSRPIRKLWADEIDKFPEESRREGGALHLAMRRTVRHWDRKHIISSTPTLADGGIWAGLLSGDWREFHVPCPKCGEWQVLTFPNIRRPKGIKDGEAHMHLDDIRKGSTYECAFCRHRIEDGDKPAMLDVGTWKPKDEPDTQYDWKPPKPGGSIASFHLPAWYSPERNFGDILANFVAAAPYPAQLHETINSDFATPWEERGIVKREKEILEHRGHYGDGTFPSDAPVLALLLVADVHDAFIAYDIRAFGPFEESWLVAYGRLPSFEALEEIMFARQFCGWPITHAYVDSKWRPQEVYEFCRRTGACPIRGEGLSAVPVRWAVMDRMPDKTPLPHALKRMDINGAHWRGALMHKLDIRRGDPGYFWLHDATGEDYAREIVAEILVERKDTRGRIHREWKKIRHDNHYLDCETIMLAAAHALRIRDMPVERAGIPPTPTKPADSSAEASAKAEAPPTPPEKGDNWKATRFPI